MEKKERAVCLNCIDGRAQIPVINWIKENYPVDYVDMITEPGMDGLLADEQYSIDEINRKINMSIEKNHAMTIFIVAHYDCRGNPVDESVHRESIRISVNRLEKEFAQMAVVGFWLNEEGKGEKVV